MPQTVPITEICRILGGLGHPPLTQMAVSQFVKDGMPKAARGKYDPEVCTYWYLGRLRKSVHRKQTESEDGKVISLDSENIRLTRAKADNEEMTAAERRGDLIPLHRYEAEMATLVGQVKSQFLNVPARIAPRLEGLTRNERKALLTASIKEVLSRLSRSSDGNASAASPAAPAAKRARARVARKPKPRKR